MSPFARTDGKLVVCSGGQRGVDASALAAAFDVGLTTGGWAPLGWITKNGPMPSLAKLGLIEHTSSKYQPRTFANVRDSDGTIRLAYDHESAGEKCTLKAIQKYNKPYLDIDLNNELPFIFDVISWIDDNNIKVLNIAGNAGKTKEEGSKIFTQCRGYLKCIFRAYVGEQNDNKNPEGSARNSRCPSP